MKTFISCVILMVVMLVAVPFNSQVQAENSNNQIALAENNPNAASVAMVQEEGSERASFEQTDVKEETTGNFFTDNWGALLMGLLGFVDLIARLTPSEKDNSIVNLLMSIFNTIIPNLKKGGGSFKLLSK